MNENKVKILILCTGNSCRSQMAEGFMKSFHENIIAFSAGTAPSGKIHPKAIRVMDEIGIDISEEYCSISRKRLSSVPLPIKNYF